MELFTKLNAKKQVNSVRLPFLRNFPASRSTHLAISVLAVHKTSQHLGYGVSVVPSDQKEPISKLS